MPPRTRSAFSATPPVAQQVDTSKAPPMECWRCAACHEAPGFGHAQASCGHRYCRDCIQQLIQLSLRGGATFPSRCCGQEVMCRSVRSAIRSSSVLEVYDTKVLEMGTPNPTYCHARRCLAFIPPKAVDGKTDTASCPLCGHSTCTICKGPKHTGICPRDTGKHLALAVAKQAGWQRCLSCGQMIEKCVGCIHITCTCGFDFCYMCGKKWKSCGCHEIPSLSVHTAVLAPAPAITTNPTTTSNNREVTDYHQSVETFGTAAAEWEVFEREARLALRLADGAAAHQEIHACCTETRLDFVRRGAHCKVCLDWMSVFVLECSSCGIRVCQRCAREDRASFSEEEQSLLSSMGIGK